MLNNLKFILSFFIYKKKHMPCVQNLAYGYDSLRAMFQIFSLISQSLFMKQVNYLENYLKRFWDQQ